MGCVLRGDDDDGAIIGPLPPSLHHVHQFDQSVGGCRHFMSFRPAHELENLTRLGRCFDSGHEFRQRYDLNQIERFK